MHQSFHFTDFLIRDSDIAQKSITRRFSPQLVEFLNTNISKSRAALFCNRIVTFLPTRLDGIFGTGNKTWRRGTDFGNMVRHLPGDIEKPNAFERRPVAMTSNQNPCEISRRSFLKTAACLTLSSLAVGNNLAATLIGKGDIALVISPDDVLASAAPPAWAVGELKTALEGQGATVRIITKVAEATADEFCVVVAGMNSPLAQTIVRRQKISAPTQAESLCIAQSETGGQTVLLVAGTDALGLVYAITELADRVSCLATGRAALEFAEPVIERPASRTRSVMRGFCCEVEDKVWFYDLDFWRSYLTTLVTSRLNRFSLPMGMAYNSADGITDGYLVFPYPFFVMVPGFDVQVKNLSAEERARNLATLKFIGGECARRGLRFQLGIWTLAYHWLKSTKATYTIDGLTDDTHAAYCREALALLLKEVPAITGVTFRVHEESGIPRGHEDFWRTQFDAIVQCGRRMEIDLHAKNMTPETLQIALATGQPVVISPKYCGEHLGLPYHPAAIRELEMSPEGSFTDTGTGILIGDRKFTRYGYADMLAENRNWDVVFRIWPGTQRFLLNGDPALFAGYGRNASFCGAAGIEWSEPLHFKGRRGSGQAGGRCAYADASLNPQYDFQKYLYTYRLWGRLGYNPDADPEIWRRALRQDFGSAAAAVENALAPASRVLPLFTLAHGPSADCASYWPEIYSNMPLAGTKLPEPYQDTRSPKLFGNVSPFDPQLFQSPDECAGALVSGTVNGKYSPLEVAQWLTDIASAAEKNLATARYQLGVSASAPDFRRIEEDVLIQRGLGLFFAGKLRSAVLWRLFTLTGNRAAGEAAIASYSEGRDAWAMMAERAKGVYLSDITYCNGRSLRGHWLDRIPAFDADIADLRERVAASVAPINKIDSTTAQRALKMATAVPMRPTPAVHHIPESKFHSGQPLVVTLDCHAAELSGVTLHYRHVNQAERWQSVGLVRTGNSFHGEVPAAYTAHRYSLQYYFEIATVTEATLFPPLDAHLANVPYFVLRRAE